MDRQLLKHVAQVVIMVLQCFNSLSNMWATMSYVNLQSSTYMQATVEQGTLNTKIKVTSRCTISEL